FEHLGDFLKDLQSMDHTQMHGWSSQDAPQWQTPTQPETHDSIVGHPQSDMTHWEMQTAPDTCAVVSQKFIIEELTGRHLSQEE
ncbi:hypothetical protein ACKI1Q_45300, partial [Streptomyces galilaeus]|uniref:hypothetical protein n=1 Tax=Streptomyces galilaeus TaxID=33899 RepID=UPI0038F6B445